MKRIFRIEPAHKKTLVEILNFERDDQRFSVETLWREGSFVVVIEEGDPVPNWEELDYFSFDSYEYYLDHTWDGVSEDFSGKNISEEELVETETGYMDDGHSYMEDNDWSEADPMIFIDGPVLAVEITGTEDASWYE